MTSIDNINSRMAATGAEHIGDGVFWSINDVGVEPSTLRELFTENNLPTDVIPKDPKPEAGFRRAIYRAQTRQSHRNLTAGKEDEQFLLRKIDEDSETIAWGVIEERKTQGAPTVNSLITATLDHHTVDRLTFDKQSGRIHSETNHDLSRIVSVLFEEEVGKFNSHDILEVLRSMMDRFMAVPIRPSGGIYFVPDKYAEDLANLRKVISQISQGSFIGVINLFGTPDSQEALTRSALEDLESSLNRLQDELNNFASTDTTRRSTIDDRAERLRDLRERVEMYSSILGFAKSGLEQGLDAAEKTLGKMLGL